MYQIALFMAQIPIPCSNQVIIGFVLVRVPSGTRYSQDSGQDSVRNYLTGIRLHID